MLLITGGAQHGLGAGREAAPKWQHWDAVDSDSDVWVSSHAQASCVHHVGQIESGATPTATSRRVVGCQPSKLAVIVLDQLGQGPGSRGWAAVTGIRTTSVASMAALHVVVSCLLSFSPAEPSA